MAQYLFGLDVASTLGFGLAQRIDSTSDAGITYVGIALAGTADSESGWAVKKIDSNAIAGTDVAITWSNGVNEFNIKWDDHLTVSYS